MTNKECRKEVEKQKLEAITINDSINWAANQANLVLDELEEIDDCVSFDCIKRKESLTLEAGEYLSKLEYENKVLDKYGEDLEKLMGQCKCVSGDFHF